MVIHNGFEVPLLTEEVIEEFVSAAWVLQAHDHIIILLFSFLTRYRPTQQRQHFHLREGDERWEQMDWSQVEEAF